MCIKALEMRSKPNARDECRLSYVDRFYEPHKWIILCTLCMHIIFVEKTNLNFPIYCIYEAMEVLSLLHPSWHHMPTLRIYIYQRRSTFICLPITALLTRPNSSSSLHIYQNTYQENPNLQPHRSTTSDLRKHVHARVLRIQTLRPRSER